MPTDLKIGLAISLFGPLLLLLTAKFLHVDSRSVLPRLALWLLALVALVFASLGSSTWLQQVGLQAPSVSNFGATALAITALLAMWPLLQRAQKALGVNSAKQAEQFHLLSELPFRHRLFLVITAGATEEVLYRGYAIGIGGYLFGSTSVAVVVSLVAFIAAHFRWGTVHLFSVFCAGLVLSMLFVATGNLLVCILAHTVVDAVGFLLAPAVLRRRNAGAPTLAV